MKLRYPINLQLFAEGEEQKDKVELTYAEELQKAKADFEAKLRAEQEAHARDVKELTEKVINGQLPPEEKTSKITAEDVQRMRNECFGGEISNLKFVDNMCKIRDYSLENGLPDPFLPHGEKIKPTASDKLVADNAEKVYKECIEYADGDPELFTQELQRRTA